MINSCGTGKPTEADGERERGSGRKRRQLFGCSGCSAVRLFGLFGCSGCSAVRLFGLFGCSGCSGCSAVRAVRAAAALLPRKAHWRAERSPTPKKLLFCCAAVLLIRCSSSPAAAPRKAHWRAQRSPTPKKLLFCCAAVLLSFCGPGLRPCRLWHSSSSHRSRRPRKAHW